VLGLKYGFVSRSACRHESGNPVLEFEHIVQINDPEDSRVKPLTRTQLWEGLLLRARNPGHFNDALSCRISSENDTGFIRHVTAGSTEFREQVFLDPQQTIRTWTAGNKQQIHAESITTIEEPAAGYLFVRFIYRRELQGESDPQLVAEHLKSAYKELDLEAISLIRLLAEESQSDQPLH
jgi:hypothetical protein